MKRCAIIGVAVETGQQRAGVGLGPDFIRGTDLINKIHKIGYVVNDYGNIDLCNFPEDNKVYNAKLPKTFTQNSLNCQTMVKNTLGSNDVLLVLGGDRTLSTGSILGHQRVKGDICVVYVSSQPNLHNPLSLKNGNMNQMPLFLLIDNMQDEIPWINEFKDIQPILPAKSLGIIGFNKVDNYERYLMNKCGIKAMSIAEVDRLGMEAVIRETLMTINPDKTKSIHLCFNCDSLDPMYAPSTGDSKSGGLTLREAIIICEYLFDTGFLKVIEFTEFNPQLGCQKDNELTRNTIVQIILTALGAKRRGVSEIDPNYYDWKVRNVHRGAKFKK